MRHPGVEAVILATPHSLHAEQIKRAVAAGLHIFCEKPLALTADEAVSYALRGRGQRGRPAAGWLSLTPAELEVARLVAEGLANKEIADKLFVSPRTVQAHLTHVYGKLRVTSRVQLAQQVARHE